ncbi:PIN domain-containing protein [bacterium]|nr:PIN domain-containing protein [bacterium]
MPRTVFLDTSFIIALENCDDVYHQRARQLDEELLREDATLLLHDGVLMEIGDGYARLGRRAKGIDLLRRLTNEQGYRVDSVLPDDMRKALSLYQSRSDKEWGLTDCVSFVLMEAHGVSEALTADVHFQQAGFRALLLETEN